MHAQYLENILASVSSFMNDSHSGHDTGAPSGTHKLALINFLSKRDSELVEKRASFLRLPLPGSFLIYFCDSEATQDLTLIWPVDSW